MRSQFQGLFILDFEGNHFSFVISLWSLDFQAHLQPDASPYALRANALAARRVWMLRRSEVRGLLSLWNPQRKGKHMGVSKNRWYPQIIHFYRVFHYKPSILRYPYYWKHPYQKILSPKNGPTFFQASLRLLKLRFWWFDLDTRCLKLNGWRSEMAMLHKKQPFPNQTIIFRYPVSTLDFPGCTRCWYF